MKSSIALVIVAVLAGCGGGGVNREDLNAEVGKALCANYAKCGAVRSEQGCLELIQPLLALNSSTTDPTQVLIDAGKVKYDANRARACLNAYANLPCNTTLFSAAIPECTNVYEGQVAAGGGCSSIECTPSTWCSPTPKGTCSGTCKARVAVGGAATSFGECEAGLVLIAGVCSKPGVAGATCSGSTVPSACEAGLFCTPDTKICKKQPVEGEACSPMLPCSGYLACVNSVCAKPADLGATCGQVSSPSCKFDLACDSSKANPVCAERFPEGATCRGSNDCNPALRCVAGQGTTALSCQKPGTLGQGCVSGSCGVELFCETSTKTCKTLLAGGSACTQTESCKGGFCTSNICKNFVSTTVCQ